MNLYQVYSMTAMYMSCRFEIMLECWSPDPEERSTFSELVATVSVLLEGIAGYMSLQLLPSTLRSAGSHFGCSDQGRATVEDIDVEVEVYPEAMDDTL